MSEVEFESLPEGHLIRKFCKEHGITDPETRQALCDLVRGVVVAAVAGLVTSVEIGRPEL